MNVKGRRITKGRILAILLIISYLLIALWVALVATDTYFPILNPQEKPITFQLRGTFYYNRPRILNAPDVDFALNFTSDAPTLAVGEPIKVMGFGYINSPAFNSVKELRVGIINSFGWPPIPQRNGFYQDGAITLNHINGTNFLVGGRTIFFQVEGTWNGRLSIIFYNGSALDVHENPDFSVPIQPHGQLVSIQQNRLNLVLTYALFILTALSIITTVRELWNERQSEKSNPPNPTPIPTSLTRNSPSPN